MENTSIWSIDTAHSEIHFKVKHMMVSTVTGAINEFEGRVETSNEDFENAKITFSAQVNSIDTRNKQRDDHLRSVDFFLAEEHPLLSFASTSFTKKNEEEYELNGNLTIRGISHPVKLKTIYNGTVVDPYGQTKAGFEIAGKINRKDFDLKWNAITEAGSVVVSEEVKLALNIQLIKQ